MDLVLDGYKIGVASAAGAPALAPPRPRLDRLLIAWIADRDGDPIQIVRPINH